MRDIRPETDAPPVPSIHTASTRVGTPRVDDARPGGARPVGARMGRGGAGSDQATAPLLTVATVDRWRLLRLVFAMQGLYYTITGLWPLLAQALPLPRLFSATQLGTDFASTLVQALTILIGLLLLLTVTRRRPDGLLVGVGLGGALAFFLVELRFRTALHGLVYADLVFEALFFCAMLGVYLAALIHDRRTRGGG